MDEELREKLARLLMLADTLSVDVPATCHYDLADQILALIKQNYVRLAKDQGLPKIPEFQYDPEEYRPYLKRGAINYSKMLSRFRKIEQEDL